MKHGAPRLVQCELAVGVFAGHTTIAVQHHLQAAVKTIDGVQVVGFAVILVGVQHDLLALLRFAQYIVGRSSVAKVHSLL